MDSILGRSSYGNTRNLRVDPASPGRSGSAINDAITPDSTRNAYLESAAVANASRARNAGTFSFGDGSSAPQPARSARSQQSPSQNQVSQDMATYHDAARGAAAARQRNAGSFSFGWGDPPAQQQHSQVRPPPFAVEAPVQAPPRANPVDNSRAYGNGVGAGARFAAEPEYHGEYEEDYDDRYEYEEAHHRGGEYMAEPLPDEDDYDEEPTPSLAARNREKNSSSNIFGIGDTAESARSQSNYNYTRQQAPRNRSNEEKKEDLLRAQSFEQSSAARNKIRARNNSSLCPFATDADTSSQSARPPRQQQQQNMSAPGWNIDDYDRTAQAANQTRRRSNQGSGNILSWQ